MKILCLHGFRTNAEIMRQQLILANLLTEHQFDTINGPIKSTETYDEIKMYFPDESIYYEWYNSPENVEQCIEYLKPIIINYDCILGFSQGACVVSLLLENNLCKYGILIAHGLKQPSKLLSNYTLHLIGLKDPFRQYGEKALEMYSNKEVYYFNDHHKIPYDTESVNKIKQYLHTIGKLVNTTCSC